jgi:phosphoribosylformimino-5-aminoimidazole carboxamide ribotide isomerase
MMQIVPVLDVQGGIVVRAIGGRRSEYLPLVSKLTNSTDPIEVASAIRARYKLPEIYVADLGAIAGAEPTLSIYDALRKDGFRLWLDAGVRETKNAEAIADHCDATVIGLETLRGPETVDEIAAHFLPSPPASGGEGMGVRGDKAIPSPGPSPKRRVEKELVFSIDLRHGVPLGNTDEWQTSDPVAIVERVVAAGIRRIIVLDLTHVGVRSGIGTEDLLRALIHRYPNVEFFAGGGVRNRNDLHLLESLGVSGVLVATALHDSAALL